MTEEEFTKIEATLRKAFPHGHADFITRVLSHLRLHNDKNHDYAAGGDPLGNFNRVSAILALYPGFPIDTPAGVAVVYMLKQVDAVLWGMAQQIKQKVEGFDSRLSDISVYADLAAIMLKENHVPQGDLNDTPDPDVYGWAIDQMKQIDKMEGPAPIADLRITPVDLQTSVGLTPEDLHHLQSSYGNRIFSGDLSVTPELKKALEDVANQDVAKDRAAGLGAEWKPVKDKQVYPDGTELPGGHE